MPSKYIYTNKINELLSKIFSTDYLEHDEINVKDITEAYYGKRGHPFFGQTHTSEWKEAQSKRTSSCKWVNDGKTESFTDSHENFISKGWVYGRLITDENRKKLSIAGTNNLFKAREGYKRAVKDLIKSGRHPSQVKWHCEHCMKSGKGKGNFTKYHGINCKERIQPEIPSHHY